MTRARRRESRYHRGYQLNHNQRFNIKCGSFSPSLWNSEEEFRQAYADLRDTFLDECEDIAVDFDGFWRLEPAVPDELRSCPDRYETLLMPADLAEATMAKRVDILDQRRAWLKKHGYR